MKILFFDLETTGLPSRETQNGNVAENFEQWPRIWQVAWRMDVRDENGEIESFMDGQYIKCLDGDWVADKTNPVPISHEQCRNGRNGCDMFPFVSNLMHDADLIVCHNLAFDSRVFESECYRLIADGHICQLPPKKSEGKPKICTMTTSTKFCAIPKKEGKGLKWPTLQELHEVLFKGRYPDAHDALADVRATSRCFWELVQLGVIDLDKAVNPEPKQ